MGVAFISYEFFGGAEGGGIGTYVRFASQMLAHRGHSVAVFTSASEPHDELDEGVEVYSATSTRDQFASSILPVFERHHAARPFDLIEGPEYGADASAIAKSFPELPLVVRLHTATSVINEINARYLSTYSKARFILGGIRRGVFPKPFWRYEMASDAERTHTLCADEITAPSESILALLGGGGTCQKTASRRCRIPLSRRRRCWRSPRILIGIRYVFWETRSPQGRA